MKIGFTGTREGMTVAQALTVVKLLVGEDELHHGDCVGADAEAHMAAEALGIEVVLHPPMNDSKRAFCTEGVKETLPPLPYLDRNREIVEDTHMLIAAPRGSESRRSGTWSTVRYARSKNRQVYVVMPNGSIR